MLPIDFEKAQGSILVQCAFVMLELRGWPPEFLHLLSQSLQ